MCSVRLRSDFHTLIKPEDASFHVVQGSQHLRVLLKLKIILLVRRLHIPIYTNASPLFCEWNQGIRGSEHRTGKVRRMFAVREMKMTPYRKATAEVCGAESEDDTVKEKYIRYMRCIKGKVLNIRFLGMIRIVSGNF